MMIASTYGNYLFKYPVDESHEARFRGMRTLIDATVSTQPEQAGALLGEWMELLGDLEPDHGLAARAYFRPGFDWTLRHWRQLCVKGLGALALSGQHDQIQALLRDVKPEVLAHSLRKALPNRGPRSDPQPAPKQEDHAATQDAALQTLTRGWHLLTNGHAEEFRTLFPNGMHRYAFFQVRPLCPEMFAVRKQLLSVLALVDQAPEPSGQGIDLEPSLNACADACAYYWNVLKPRWDAGRAVMSEQGAAHS